MKTKTKVILDEWIGKNIVLLLNLFARILGRILSINHSLEKAPRRIAVCKFLGMGSIIQATPLLQTLRNNFPDAELIFITSSGNAKLLESVDVVDRTLCINDSGVLNIIQSTFSVLSSLWKNKVDLYIDLETYSFYSTAVATMSCARNRFGFYRIERNIRMGVYTNMMFFNSRAPISQSYLQMARLAGCKKITNELYRFKIEDGVRRSMIQKIVSIVSSEKAYIIINPNASDLRVERRWPQANVVNLIERLAKANPEKNIFLIGGKGEEDWVKGIYNKLNKEFLQHVFNTTGLFTLSELFALIDGSDLVVSNDTGPMHISFALGRPTISLFGPASPSQYGQNPNAFGIYKNIYCSPCVHDFITPPCHGDNQCMKQITVDEVYDLCNKILSEKNFRQDVVIPTMNYVKNDRSTSLGIIQRLN